MQGSQGNVERVEIAFCNVFTRLGAPTPKAVNLHTLQQYLKVLHTGILQGHPGARRKSARVCLGIASVTDVNNKKIGVCQRLTKN